MMQFQLASYLNDVKSILDNVSNRNILGYVAKIISFRLAFYLNNENEYINNEKRSNSEKHESLSQL